MVIVTANDENRSVVFYFDAMLFSPMVYVVQVDDGDVDLVPDR